MSNELSTDELPNKKPTSQEKQVQKALKKIDATQMSVTNTLRLIEENGLDFDSSLVNVLQKLETAGAAILDSGTASSKKDADKYFALVKKTDDLVNDSTNAVVLNQLRSVSDEQNLRTVASERLYLKFRDSMAVTGQSMQEFVSSNISEISGTDLAKEVTKTLPMALAGPFGPVVSALGDVVDVGAVGSKMFGTAKGALSSIFGSGDDTGKEADATSKQAEALSEAMKPTEALNKESAKDLASIDRNIESVANGQYIAQEDARDASESQSKNQVEAINNLVRATEDTTEAVKDGSEDDEKGSAMGGLFKPLGMILAPFTGVLSKLMSPLSLFSGGLAMFPKALTGTIGSLLGTVKAFPKALMKGGGKVLKGGLALFAAAHVINSFSDAADELGAMSPEEVDSYGGGIGESGGMLNFGLAYFRKGFNTILGGVPDQFSSWLRDQDWFTAIIDGIFTEDGRERVVTSAMEWFNSAMDSLVGFLGPILEPVLQPLFEAFDNIKEAFGNVQTALMPHFESFMSMIDSVGETVNRVLDPIMMFLSDMQEGLASFSSAIMENPVVQFMMGDSASESKTLQDRIDDTGAVNKTLYGNDEIDFDKLANSDLSPQEIMSIAKNTEDLKLPDADRERIAKIATTKHKMLSAKGTAETLQPMERKSKAASQQSVQNNTSNKTAVAVSGNSKSKQVFDPPDILLSMTANM